MIDRRNSVAGRAGAIGAAVALLLLSTAAGADLRMGITPTKLHLSLEPGARQTTTVEISNNGDEAIRVIAYIVDWTTPREGGMNFAPPGEIDRSASGWVETDLSEFILPPHDSQIVRVTAALPDTARGSYWTLIFFEGEGEVRRRALGIGAKARLGTTVYLTAAGSEEREDALTGMEIGRSPGSDTLQLVASLANRGNVYYYPEGWIQVLDEGGQVLFEETVPLRVLLPGRETVYRLPWLPGAPGEHRLVATFDSGLETLMQGVKRFVVPETPLEEPPVDEPPAVDRPVIADAAPEPPVEKPPSVSFEDSLRFYGVHVESFATDEEVAVAKRAYVKKKYPITIKTVALDGKGTWHRVILGRFADKAEAKEFADELADTYRFRYSMVVRLE